MCSTANSSPKNRVTGEQDRAAMGRSHHLLCCWRVDALRRLQNAGRRRRIRGRSSTLRARDLPTVPAGGGGGAAAAVKSRAWL